MDSSLLTFSTLVLLLLSPVGWGGCSHTVVAPAPVKLTESPVVKLPLGGDLASADAEVSGLAWAGDDLILLPQFPDFGARAPRLFILPKAELETHLGGGGGPLTPRDLRVEPVDVMPKIPHFQGFEAIVVEGERVWLAVECMDLTRQMSGFIIPGEISPDHTLLTLHPDRGVVVPVPVQNFNTSFEALTLTSDGLYAFFEANSPSLVPHPVVRHFSFDLQPLPDINIAAINYRVTDAAAAVGGQETWVVNYFYPGSEEYAVERDDLAWTYGVGPTHAKYPHVERLLRLELGPGGFGVVAEPPRYLELEKDSRNWEGLALWPGKGFLMVTDKFPGTVLGFVALP